MNMSSQPGPSISTVAETLSHPAYPTAIWKLQPDKQGLAPVAEGRGGPFNISWGKFSVTPISLLSQTHTTHTLTYIPLRNPR